MRARTYNDLSSKFDITMLGSKEPVTSTLTYSEIREMIWWCNDIPRRLRETGSLILLSDAHSEVIIVRFHTGGTHGPEEN